MITAPILTTTLTFLTFLTSLSTAQGLTLVCGTNDNPPPTCGTGLQITANTCLDMCLCAPAGSGLGMVCGGFVGCDVFSICASQFDCDCTTPPA